MNEKETVELELEHEDLFQLMLMAHEKDTTLNQLITLVLREEMDNANKQ